MTGLEQTPKVPVGAHVVAVPDGFRKDADGRRWLRLSLAVTPDVNAGQGTIDLYTWPSGIASLARKIRIAVATLKSNGVENAKDVGGEHASDVPESFGQGATALWQSLFKRTNLPGDPVQPFVLLKKELSEPLHPAAKALVAERTEAGTYHAADLARFADALYGGSIAATLRQRMNGAQALAARSAGEDPGTPTVAWWHWAKREWFDTGRPVRREPVTALAARVQVRALAVNETPRQRVLQRMRAEGRTRVVRLAGAAAVGPAVASAAPRVLAVPPAAVALRAAAADVREAARTASFWAPPAVTSTSASSGVLQEEIAAFEVCRGLGRTRRPQVAALAEAAAPAEADPPERRKLSAILSFPTLAKFLGLIVDVEVDETVLADTAGIAAGSRGHFAIGCAFEPVGSNWPPSDNTVRWTAATLDRSADLPFFGPCSHDDFVPPKQPETQFIKNGLLNLAAKIPVPQTPLSPTTSEKPELQPRFELTSVDVSNTMLALSIRSDEITVSDAHGRQPSEQVTKLPNVASRGIALIDRLPPESPPPPQVVAFADDLLLGYRIDVALPKRGDTALPEAKRWRSLNCRTVTYRDQDVSGTFTGLTQVELVQPREDGNVRRATSTTKYVNEDGSSTTAVVDHPKWFTWTGESLAVPSLHVTECVNSDLSDPRVVTPKQDDDLMVGITYKLPTGKGRYLYDRRPAPLRDGRSYWFAARPVFVNGCGLTLDDAIARYTASGFTDALGGDDGGPFVFHRRGEVPAPDVCLPWNDPVVTAPDATGLRGETVDTLVVRSGTRRTTLARRFLMPARATFDICEQAGTFDDVHDPTPKGAFAGAIPLCVDPETGALPVARDGRITICDPPSADGQASDQHQSRGAVVVIDRKHTGSRVPYYADPLARRLGTRILTATGAIYPSTLRSFWDRDEQPRDAAPILLEITAGPRAVGGAALASFDATGATAPMPMRTGGTVTVPRLGIHVAQAEVVEIDFWSLEEVDKLQSSHWALARGLQELQRLGATVAPDAIDQALTRASVPGLNNRRTVRVVHAVAQPLDPPEVVVHDAILRLHPIVRAVRPPKNGDADTTLPAGLRSWADYLLPRAASIGNLWTDATAADRILPSEAGGTMTFFAGEIQLDRPSSVSIRADATWREFGGDSLHWEQGSDKWIYQAALNTATIFTVRDISADAPFRGKPLNVLLVDGVDVPTKTADLRGLSHAFPNGKARHLFVTLTATSRFVPFFETVDANTIGKDPNAIRKYECPSKAECAVWLPATFRPLPPEIDRVLPVFGWDQSSSRDGSVQRATRKAWVRVCLKAGTWHSTGEGEALAVVFAAPPTATPDLCAFEEAVRPFQTYVTRWGTDPIHRSGPLPLLATNDQFPPTHTGDQPGVDGLRLPFATDPTVASVEPNAGTIPAHQPLKLTGERFTADVVVWVRGADQTVAVRGRVDPLSVTPTGVTVTFDQPMTAPFKVTVESPRLSVRINAYQPQPDLDEGQFYCDIALNEHSAYYPFVQLGLARYQPHAVEGLELSPAVTTWVQFPPTRDVEVSIDHQRNVTVHVWGVGYYPAGYNAKDYDANDLPSLSPVPPAFSDVPEPFTAVPVLKVTLMRSTFEGRLADSDGWIPQIGPLGQPLSGVFAPAVTKNDPRHRVDWTLKAFSLPPQAPGVRYGALIEEVELMRGDPDDPSAAASGLPNRTVERGPMFSYVVDLGE
jgi:hypothetical protein